MRKEAIQNLRKRGLALLVCLLMIVSMVNLRSAWTMDPSTPGNKDQSSLRDEHAQTLSAEEKYESTDAGCLEESDNPEIGHVHHFEAKETVEPTCTEKGYTVYECECGEDSYRSDETEALGHNWDEGAVTAEATENSVGSITYTCQVCGEVHTETIPKLDHNTAEEKQKPEEKKDVLPPKPAGDPFADVENTEFWDGLFESVELTGNRRQDLLTVAVTQLGYTESSRNFEATVNADGDGYDIRGWTRYGAWYGVPYGDWCAMFISFCMHYAGISPDVFPYEAATIPWVENLKKLEMFSDDVARLPSPGDLVFFDWEDDDLPNHVGLVFETDDENGIIRTIEGNRGDRVQMFEYKLSDRRILGYGILPENSETHEAGDSTENHTAKVETAEESILGLLNEPEKKGGIVTDLNENDPLLYMDENGAQQIQDEYEAFSGELEGGKWYAVQEDVETGQIVISSGSVNLVLCDGTTLTVNGGITVLEGASLTIWAQKNYSGQLIAMGNRSSESNPIPGLPETPGIPGIGGAPNASGGCGSITINGGHITAVGGAQASGIGSAEAGGCGNITINGGADGSRTYVTASGGRIPGNSGQESPHSGVGIGGNSGSGIVTINGGSITSTGGLESAGIGGNSRNVVINGGIVNAYGGRGGAGIGGSFGGTNGNVTISGGEIRSTAINPEEEGYQYRNSAAAIGAGGGFAQGGKIEISGGTVVAKSYGMGAGIGGAEDGSGNGCAGGVVEISGVSTNVIALSVYGAGIGSGGADVNVQNSSGAGGGSITISNGFVYALSSAAGAGVGGGNKGNGGILTVNNGYVVACAGPSFYDAASADLVPYGWSAESGDRLDEYMEEYLPGVISEGAAGLRYTADYSGAGIGGGDGGSGGTVTVNGGTVVAKGGSNNCSAIGSGNYGREFGNLALYDYAKLIYGSLSNSGICEIEGMETYRTEDDMRITMAHISAYARIERGDVIVQFDVGEHGTAPESQHVILGGCASEPQTPEADGWLFEHWYADPEYTTAFEFDNPVNESITIYGKWIRAYSLTVKKEWPDCEYMPNSVSVLVQNDYADTNSASDTIILEADSDWTAFVQVSTESELTFTEEPVGGFRTAAWKLRSGNTELDLTMTESGSATLNLREQNASVIECLVSGDAEVVVTNARTYTVQKLWDCEPQTYSGTDQYGTVRELCFEWPDAVGYIEAALQHRHNASEDDWETIEVLTLTGDEQWIGTFSTPITDDESNYRIREMITAETRNNGYDCFVLPEGENELLLLDEDDTDGDGETPRFVYRHTETEYDSSFEGIFGVSYDWDDEGQFIIRNRKCVFFTAEKIWEGENSGTLKPERILLALQHAERGESTSETVWATIETRELCAGNGWKTRFEHVCGDSEDPLLDYRVRELDGSGELVYAPDDGDKPSERESIAVFPVTDEENAPHRLLYYVTYSADTDGHTVVTNRGRVFNAEKVWDIKGDNCPSSVYVSLEHLKSRSNEGEEYWEQVSRKMLGRTNNWRTSFSPVWEDGEYRVREMTGADGSIIYDRDDTDGTGADPVVTWTYLVYHSSDPKDYSYSTDTYNVMYRTEGQDTVIINRQEGIFFVEMNWEIDEEGILKPEQAQVVLQRGETVQGSSETVWSTVETLELGDENNWSGRFQHICEPGESVAEYRIRELTPDGRIIDAPDNTFIWTVGEGTDAEDVEYAVSYLANEYGKTTIINSAKFRTAEKRWEIDAAGLQKPESIHVVLQAGVGHAGSAESEWTNVETKELNEENNWKVCFLLRGDDMEGNPVFRIRELDAEGRPADEHGTVSYPVRDGDNARTVKYLVSYDTDSSGNRTLITNTAVVDVNVVKHWEMPEDAEEPQSITVHVMNGNTVTASSSITAEDGWERCFSNLPAYRNGEEITYTVLEEPVFGYHTEVEDYEITNSKILTGVDLGATKTLTGGTLREGEFLFQLRDPYGRLIQTKTNDANGNVRFDRIVYSCDDMRLDEEGNPVDTRLAYTIREVTANNELTYDGHTETVTVTLRSLPDGTIAAETDKTAGEIRFTNSIEKVHLTVDKIWQNQREHEDYIPEKVTVRLYSNGSLIRTVNLTEAGNWHYDFGQFNKYDGNHREIIYTLTEDIVHYWIRTVKLEDGHFTVTNRFTEETYTITYKTNGGVWSNGGSEDRYDTQLITKGTTIRAAPVRQGYSFVEWKGSSYQPGDAYNEKNAGGYYVSDTLVAQWKKSPKTGDPDKPGLWIGMALGSAAGLTLGIYMVRKHRKRPEH